MFVASRTLPPPFSSMVMTTIKNNKDDDDDIIRTRITKYWFIFLFTFSLLKNGYLYESVVYGERYNANAQPESLSTISTTVEATETARTHRRWVVSAFPRAIFSVFSVCATLSSLPTNVKTPIHKQTHWYCCQVQCVSCLVLLRSILNANTFTFFAYSFCFHYLHRQ